MNPFSFLATSSRFLGTRRSTALFTLLGASLPVLVQSAESPIAIPPGPFLTNVAQLRHWVGQERRKICSFRLEGVVRACSMQVANCNVTTDGPEVNLQPSTCDLHLFLEDDSGTELFELDWGGQPLQPGQQVRLQGTNCSVTTSDIGLKIGQGPVVNNDGCHPRFENSGASYLEAGRHPFKLVWFNCRWDYSLRVSYEGPGLPRQRIPNSALSRLEAVGESERGSVEASERRNVNAPTLQRSDAPANFLRGINYRCYEGGWHRLPDFDALTPVKTGISPNFDLAVITRKEDVGLAFTGFIEVPNTGLYQFFVSSDDGSQLFLNENAPELSVIGSQPVPPSHRLAVGQVLSEAEEQSYWSEIEGEVTFLEKGSQATELELSSSGGHLRIRVLNNGPLPPRSPSPNSDSARGGGVGGEGDINASDEPPVYLLHSRIRAAGICRASYTEQGQKLAGVLLTPSWQNIEVLNVSPEFWSAFKLVSIGELLHTNLSGLSSFVHARGRLLPDDRTAGPQDFEGRRSAVLADETGEIPVETLMTRTEDANATSDVLGCWSRVGAKIILQHAILNAPTLPRSHAPTLPLLTTAKQVQQLKREEAKRAYPVNISGVITWLEPDFAGFVLQDASRAIYVRHDSGWVPDVPHLGEYWQVEGVSDPADFSPIVKFKRATRLGMGRLPEPVHPTWDQLMNGSLDAQYVEIQGIVTAVQSNRVTLLTRDGKINVELSGTQHQSLASLENALIRARGCLFPDRNWATHQVNVKRWIELGNATFTVDEMPPLDPFQAEKKSAAQLLLFDTQAGAFQRVKVCGQIVHGEAGTYYMMDGTNGLRFQPKAAVQFQPGDQVEVAGFVELGGPSPVLREAVARKTGRTSLPQPRKLMPSELLNESHDSTLVRLEGVLLELREGRTGQVLEIQAGLRTLIARLPFKDKSLRALKAGSRLELTGVHAGQSVPLSSLDTRHSSPPELLLNSASDVRVIARPPWWTLQRLLVITGVLATILVLALGWITLLRRQVEKRTAQLQQEIRERERAEHQRAIEQERSRIARDLHDDLGSILTEISMLATPRGPAAAGASRGSTIKPEEASERLELIAGKSRCTVTALDELVWAVNPQNDTLSSLAKYLASYTEEYLSTVDVLCRVQIPPSFPNLIIPAEARHNLLLTVKEALSNAIRHGRATEVLFRLTLLEKKLEILIQDNGHGFDCGIANSGNGLTNLRDRMHSLNGSCIVESSPRQGTTVSLTMPLA